MNKIIISLLFFALFSVTLASAQQYDCPMGGMMYGLYGNYGIGMMLFSWIIGLLIIALLIAAIYWLVKNANRKK